MSIETTYKEILLENYIKAELKKGNIVSAEDAVIALETAIENLNLAEPQFDHTSYTITEKEYSSATKHNNTFSKIQEDLNTVYKDMLNLTRTSINSYERWRTETRAIEKELIDLEDRIEDLTLLTQNTEGLHSVLIDNFTDTFHVDPSYTTVYTDLNSQSVYLKESESTPTTKVFLNDLDAAQDVFFKVRTQQNFKSRSDASSTSVINPFKQDSDFWWTSIEMTKARPVTCEYLIRLGTNATNISRIFMDIHDSIETNELTITPLYSTDGVSYYQLPTVNYFIRTKNLADFTFETVSAKWVKFILTKPTFDFKKNDNSFIYQFGFKEISFYDRGFDVNEVATTAQTLISWPRYQVNSNEEVLPFEKLVLEACERIEDETDIKYYITTSSLPSVPVSSSTVWVPISPTNRSDAEFPYIYTVGEADTNEITNVGISYDASASNTDLINPAETFNIVSVDTNGTIQTESATVASEAIRYRFSHPDERILNHQLKLADISGGDSGTYNPLSIKDDTLKIFRNVGTKGLLNSSSSSFVRGVMKGWRFEDPWYSCVVEILDPRGITIDVGDKPIYIDDIRYTNQIDGTILTGKTSTRTGLHTIRVHKNNWKYVTPEATTLTQLKSYDSLYPYNHRYLIEGYSYASTYTDTEIYTGVDLFAEKLLKQVSIFDFINNATENNYDVFALDKDAPYTHTGNNLPTQVFVINTDPTNPDFINEKFTIRFQLVNEFHSYLRIRADFTTENANKTPVLYSYKIKLT